MTLLASIVLAALSASAVPAAALTAEQARQTGTLRIVVRDPSGAVIPNAAVVVKGAEPATQDVVVPAVSTEASRPTTNPTVDQPSPDFAG